MSSILINIARKISNEWTINSAGTTLIVACTVGTNHDIGLHVFMSLTLIGLTITTFILVSWCLVTCWPGYLSWTHSSWKIVWTMKSIVSILKTLMLIVIVHHLNPKLSQFCPAYFHDLSSFIWLFPILSPLYLYLCPSHTSAPGSVVRRRRPTPQVPLHPLQSDSSHHHV